MHHFPFHISDFAQATARFTPEQVGVFLALLMEYYKTEKPLPADLEELCFLAGAMTSAGKKAVQFVLKRCFVLNDAGSAYHQRRCDREIEAYRGRCVQNSFAILCRHWEKVNRGHAKPTFEQFQQNPAKYYDAATGRILAVTGRSILVLESNDDGTTAKAREEFQPVTSNHDPETNNQDTPVVPKGTPTIEGLAEAVYALYPKKVGKAAALKAIVKVLKAGTITELELQTKVRAYAEAVAKWSEQDTTFIPNPATWFNQHRFEDDPATWIREPADPREKKKGAALPQADSLFASPPKASEAPRGWQTAMAVLFGDNWADHYPAFETMPPADQRQVRAWLEKKGPGAFECPTPPDWREHWMMIFGDLPCPETWDEVCKTHRQAIVESIEQKKEGGAAE